ncbi:MAG TPA: NADH-quinone oxidoreductase subunit N [Vicinamibacterales bacterium]|nr:NADH-quinone oxidoreductase subunit N [Vicinamibacterales bacterium]
MSGEDFRALLPLLILAATPLAVMLAVAVRRGHALAAGVSAAGHAAAFASLLWRPATLPRPVAGLLVADLYGYYYWGLLLAASLAVTLLGHGFWKTSAERVEEFHLLVPLGTLGSAVLVSSTHLVTLFLGLEILSLSLFGLIAYERSRVTSLEAGLKYLILSSAASAFLLFGMALIYAELGSMQFRELAAAGVTGDRSVLLLAGLGLLVAGLGFKLSLVPFHLWTPDVYQGAPAPVSAFIATVSKAGVLGLLLRFFIETGTGELPAVTLLLSLVALASMYAGNLLALLQSNLKRLLAYSSISHLGYALVALVVPGVAGPEAATFYITAYVVTILAAFGVVTALSTASHEAEWLEHYRGLFWRRPLMGATLTAALLSLAGIPLTAGFLGKFLVVAAGVSALLWVLVISVVVTSTIGLFYYLRVLVAVYAAPEADTPAPAVGRLPVAAAATLAALVFALVWLGVYPTGLIDAIRDASASLTRF